jgi:hypothetical protein
MAGDRVHGINVRGTENAPPRSPLYEGRFGRLFRKLPPATHPDGFLADLAQRMHEEAASSWNAPGNDSQIPAGYTYLGQFIDHDVTFDPVSSLMRANDPDALVDFRTPKFDLDSLYGSGPADDAFLYDRSGTGLKLLLGKGQNDDGSAASDDDLPRNVQGRALLGDPRNDENIVVSQLHLAFAKAHNRAVDEVAGRFDTDEGRLDAAQRIVRWRYQWIVVNDYLRRILDPAVYGSIVTGKKDDPFKLKYYKAKKNAYLPVEFSVAAFRFGHSMVRPSYVINDVVPSLPLFKPGPAGQREDFRGFRPLPSQWTITWPRFFPIGGSSPQTARKIDTHLAEPLFTLPDTSGDMQSLAFRNLRRGLAFELPSGQAVAAKVGAVPLTSEQLGFIGDAPLWFYVLKEAEIGGAEHLGPVGSRIVGETLFGLLEIDPLSYVNAGGWPEYLTEPVEGFSMGDFLQWAVPDQV